MYPEARFVVPGKDPGHLCIGLCIPQQVRIPDVQYQRGPSPRLLQVVQVAQVLKVLKVVRFPPMELKVLKVLPVQEDLKVLRVLVDLKDSKVPQDQLVHPI